MKQNSTSKLKAFEQLLAIVDELREKCPWDRQQTMDSLRHLTVEEAFELSEAISEQDKQQIKKELGDLLLHIILYARIATEKNDFTLVEVIESLCTKLIHRHPHVYGNVKAKDTQAVKQNWEKLKLKEKGNHSVLGGVPKALPALIKAIRIQEKASMSGFDWKKKEEVIDKLQEEIQELHQVITKISPTKPDTAKIEDEFGDVLFSLINYARFLDINPERALEKTNKKFIQRFQYIEAQAAKKGIPFFSLSLQEMNSYWDEAKQIT